MELHFLKALARRSLPLTFSGREEVEAVRKLSEIGSVRATYVKEARGEELVVVHEITEHGRATLDAALDRNEQQPRDASHCARLDR